MVKHKRKGIQDRVSKIHLSLPTSNSMGRGIMSGFSAYGGHRLDWQCGLLDPTHSTNIGPPFSDGLIGVVNPEIRNAPDSDHRRRVINTSRSRDIPGICSVTCDDFLIGQLAAEHLLSKDLKAFAYFGAESDREVGFANRIAKYQQPYERLVKPETEREELISWLAALPKRTGILAFNDHEAVRLLWIAQATGRAIPEDLAIVGVDADEVQSLLSPVPITSVDPNFFLIGYEAAKLLDRILKEGYDACTERIYIPPARIVEKASSDFAGINDPFVVQAARFIRRYACEGITAGDVVEAMPLSRRPLERRFRNTFNRTLLQEIQRVRIAEVASLLTRSQLPISAIVEETGFKSHARLTQLFGKLVGMSPAEYRRQHRKSNTNAMDILSG